MDKLNYEDFGLTKESYDYLKNKEDKLFDINLKILAIFGVLIAVTIALVTGDYSAVESIVAKCILGGILGVLGGMLSGTIFSMVLSSFKYNIVTKYKKIRAYDIAKRKYDDWWARRQIGFWASMNGRRFEQELAALYGHLGYSVNLTPSSGDKGIDIEMKKDGEKSNLSNARPIKTPLARMLPGIFMEL